MFRFSEAGEMLNGYSGRIGGDQQTNFSLNLISQGATLLVPSEATLPELTLQEFRWTEFS